MSTDRVRPTGCRQLHITCVIYSLGPGGAERVLTTLTSGWADDHVVTIVTLDTSRVDFYPQHPAVKRVRLDLAARSQNVLSALLRNIRRVALLRRTIRDSRPDIVVSFMDTTNVLSLLAATGLSIPVVACERTDPTNPQRQLGRPWKFLRRLLYPFAAAVVVQTRAVRIRLKRWRPRIHVLAIANPIPAALLAIPLQPEIETRRKRLVALGRLGKEKGFDLLLSAFASIAAESPCWDLWIWGEGPERKRLEAMRAELGLEDRVFLPGLTRTPWEEILRGSVFVLPSLREGFPSALLEAMALGRASVAFDCDSGPREITLDGRIAALLPSGDVRTLASSLSTLMADASARNALAIRGLAVRDRYRPELIARVWDELFAKVVQR